MNRLIVPMVTTTLLALIGGYSLAERPITAPPLPPYPIEATEAILPEALQNRVRAAHADRLGVSLETVYVVSAQSNTWNDSCLGLGGPTEICMEVITKGWQMNVITNGEDRAASYHTDLTGENIRRDARDQASETFPEALEALVRETHADYLGIPVDAVQVLGYSSETWSDSCLGLGGPAESCLAAQTEGWKVEVGDLTDSAGGTFYHLDSAGNSIRRVDSNQSSTEPLPEAIALAVLQAHASYLGVPTDELKIVKYSAETWSDGCLGLGGPAEGCLAALTEGWQVEIVSLSDPDDTAVYHTDSTGNNIRRSTRSCD
ncbi:MAG: hypothetical protein AAFV85_15860 [Cyanobacteria bacterium J06634_6]